MNTALKGIYDCNRKKGKEVLDAWLETNTTLLER